MISSLTILKSVAFASLCLFTVALCNSFLQVDEREAIHTAWKIVSGETIYLDFFQHHNPLFYYLLAPVLNLFGDSNAAVYAARFVTGCFGAGIVCTTWWLTRQLATPHAAWLSVTLVIANPIFLGTGVDVRPDVPQVFFNLLGITLAYCWLVRPSRKLLLASAICTGIAFLALQKAVIPGFALGLVWALRAIRGEATITDLVLWCLTAATTAFLVVPFYYLSEQLVPWYEQNIQLNLISDTGLVSVDIDEIRRSIGRLWWLGVPIIGLPIVLFKVKVSRDTTSQKRIRWQAIELALLVMVVGGFSLTYRVQYFQYYLSLLPLLCVACSWIFCAMVSKGSEAKTVFPIRYSLPLIAIAIFTNAALSRDYGRSRLTQQLVVLEEVRQLTRPGEVVYDELMLCNLFRSDLHFFWFSVGSSQQIAKYQRIRSVSHDSNKLIEDKATKLSCYPGTQKLSNSAGVPIYQEHSEFPGIYVRRLL